VTIVDLMISRVDAQMKNRDMAIEVTAEGKKLLAKKGYDPVLGARPLRRTIQREIEDTVSEKILYGEFTAGQIVVVDVEGSGGTDTLDDEPHFTFRGEDKPIAPDAVPVEPAGSGSGNASSTETA
jgi:ATP-dependent Clp protease ATP-binding subunit ClpC